MQVVREYLCKDLTRIVASYNVNEDFQLWEAQTNKLLMLNELMFEIMTAPTLCPSDTLNFCRALQEFKRQYKQNERK